MISALCPNIMMRKKWFHSRMTAWTRALGRGLNSQPLSCAANPPTCLRWDQGRCGYCAEEKTVSLSESCFVWAAFFFLKENHHISQQRPSFLFNFHAARILWSHCVGPWRTVPRMIPGRSRKALLEIHLCSWLLPQNSPLGTVSSRQEDG